MKTVNEQIASLKDKSMRLFSKPFGKGLPNYVCEFDYRFTYCKEGIVFSYYNSKLEAFVQNTILSIDLWLYVVLEGLNNYKENSVEYEFFEKHITEKIIWDYIKFKTNKNK